MPPAPATPADRVPVPSCWALLRSASVGRLATATVVGSHVQPEIRPVNYLVDHGSIVVRTAGRGTLSGAIGRPVAFEADGYEAATVSAWSVLVKGVLREIREMDEAMDALNLPLSPWHPGAKPVLMRLEPTGVTGIRFAVSGGWCEI